MKVGPYELEAQLGRGGSGSVHRARGPDGKLVAIKLLLRQNADTLARFERERRLLDALGAEHGFVELLGAGDSPAGPWIAMPLLTGGTLRDKLRERIPLPPDSVVALGRALARALALAHQRGIVHRDLKPENVLFDAAGTPLVADLGIAKHFRRDVAGASQSVALSKAGEIRGTPAYMAPEVLHDSTSATPAADVFSLGAILYECLAARPAFVSDDGTPFGLLVKVASGKVVPLGTINPEVPPWLVAVIERALAVSLDLRYADAASLGRALEGSEDPVESPRRPRLAVVASLGALLVAGAVAWAARGGAKGDALPVTVGPAASSGAPSERRFEPAPWGEVLLDAEEQQKAALAFEREGRVEAALDAWHRVLDSTRASAPARRAAMTRARILAARVSPRADPARAAVWRVKVFVGARAPMPDVVREDLDAALESWRKTVLDWTRGEVRLELDRETIAEPITKQTVLEGDAGVAVYPLDLPFDVTARRLHGAYDSVVSCVYMGLESDAPRAWFMKDAGRFANAWGMLHFRAGELRGGPAEDLLFSWLHHVRVAFAAYQGLPRGLFADPGGPADEAKPCDCPGVEAGSRLAQLEHLAREHVTPRMWRAASTLRVTPSPWNGGDVHAWRVVGPVEFEGDFEGVLGRTGPSEDVDTFNYSEGDLARSAHRFLNLEVLHPGSGRRAALLRTWVRAPRPVKARLLVGSALGVRLLLDDAVVLEHVPTGRVLDEDQVPVELAVGWHRLLAKVVTDKPPFALSLRVVDADGLPIPGLELAPDRGK